MNKHSDLVYFGVREQQENGSVDHVVLEFDFKNFKFSKYLETAVIFSVSFGEIADYYTEGEQVIISFTRVPSPTGRFTPFNLPDLEDLVVLLNTIKDNIQEVLNQSTTVIRDYCITLKPLICMRKCEVSQKSFKRKGKRVGLSKFVRKPNQQRTSSCSVGFLVLTNKNLLCFEDPKSVLPICIYPVSAIDIKKPSSDSINITCSGDKGVFVPVSEGDEVLLFFNAWKATLGKNKQIYEEIKTIIDQLQLLFEGTFDKSCEEHIDWLRRLWEASNLGIADSGGEPIPFEIQTNRWKDLGFQRDDPVSDLRATGLLGLQNLVYFAEQHPGLFISMARDQQQSSEMEYPFATAGINITFLLITLLGLRNPPSWYPTVDTHPLFFYNPHAWEELYTIIFRLFDQKWNQMLVGYMGFQKVIDRTREDVAGLLRHKNPMSGEDNVPFIFEMLGILLNDLDSFKTDTHRKQEKAVHAFAERSAIVAELPGNTSENLPKPDVVEIPVDTNSNDETSVDISNVDTPQQDNASAPTTLNRKSFASLPTPNSAWRTPTTPSGGKPRVFSIRGTSDVPVHDESTEFPN